MRPKVDRLCNVYDVVKPSESAMNVMTRGVVSMTLTTLKSLHSMILVNNAGLCLNHAKSISIMNVLRVNVVNMPVTG